MQPAILGASAVVGAFAVVFGAMTFWPSGQKCDAPDVTKTVKDLANQRLASLSSVETLLQKGGTGLDLAVVKGIISDRRQSH